MKEVIFVMKAIFLDIDGVLNAYSTNVCTKSGAQFVDDNLIEKLKRIIDETGANVVLSSDWRYDRDYEECNGDYLELKDKLAEYDITFYGFTPEICQEKRGIEVDAYLKAHPEIDKFVILDDRCDLAPHKHRLVRTNTKIGLTDEDVEEAIWLLNN